MGFYYSRGKLRLVKQVPSGLGMDATHSRTISVPSGYLALDRRAVNVTRREDKKGEIKMLGKRLSPGSAVVPSSPQRVAYMWQVF